MNRDEGDEVDWQEVASNIVKEIPMLLVDYNCKCLLAKKGTNFKICYCPIHAAAPELLEACKSAYGELVDIYEDRVDNYKRTERIITSLRTLIAKTEGE